MVGGLVMGALEKLYHQPSRGAWPRLACVRAGSPAQKDDKKSSRPAPSPLEHRAAHRAWEVLVLGVSLTFSTVFVNMKARERHLPDSFRSPSAMHGGWRVTLCLLPLLPIAVAPP